MVSPPKKFVQAAFLPAFSSDGERVLFKSTAGLAGTPGLQSSIGDYYVAGRGPLGWTVAPTSPPLEAQIVTGSNSGGPYAFSPDLSRWILFGATQPQGQVGVMRFFQGGLGLPFSPLSPLLQPIDDSGNQQIGTAVIETRFSASSTDLSTTAFRPRFPTTTYLPGDPATTAPNQNEYLVSNAAGAPAVFLLARDRMNQVFGGACGSLLGGGVGSQRVAAGGLFQGAIGAGGSPIYFTARPAQPQGSTCDEANPLRVLARTETPAGPEISGLAPSVPSAGDDLFQGASTDSSKAYFTSPRQLVAGDQDSGPQCDSELGQTSGCDLYIYDSALPVGARLIQASAGGVGDPTPGEDANVLSSITAISGDGSHAYFAAEGVLTSQANPAGDTAVPGEPNLYLYERDAAHPAGRTAFVGTLAEADEEVLWGVESSFAGGAYAVPLRGQNGPGNEVGGDGHILLFASNATLLAADADGGHRDVYRYNADADALACISCAGNAAFDVSVNPNEGKVRSATFTEPGRWVSEDGETVGFASAEPLAAGDGDGAANPYVWKSGQLARLPAVVEQQVQLPTVSAAGDEVAFTTVSALLPADGDTATDVYVARADGGFANPVPGAICSQNCQGPPSTAPPPADAASSTFKGSGNVKPRRHHKKKKHGKRHRKKQKVGHQRGGRR